MGDPWLRRRLYYLALTVVCVVVFIAATVSYDPVILPIVGWFSTIWHHLFGAFPQVEQQVSPTGGDPGHY